MHTATVSCHSACISLGVVNLRTSASTVTGDIVADAPCTFCISSCNASIISTLSAAIPLPAGKRTSKLEPAIPPE
eukprot:721226-Prymnesium_polylepis.1